MSAFLVVGLDGGMIEVFKPPEKLKAIQSPPKNDNFLINRPQCTIDEPKKEEGPKVPNRVPKPEPTRAALVEE